MARGGQPPQGDDDLDYEYEAVDGHWDPDAPTTSLEPAGAPTHPPAPAVTETVVLAARLQAIVDAAEQSAQELRDEAERRSKERIAEADRAAAFRVAAAEEEAAAIIVEAGARAEQSAAEAVNVVDTIHAEAAAALKEARETLAQAQFDAEKLAKETISRARDEAREIVGAAHLATREVMQDGGELTEHLRELSTSLNRNAERLLRDIRLAHGSMTARLDQALPEGTAALPRSTSRDAEGPRERAARGDHPASSPRRGPVGEAIDFDVPDFVVRKRD